LIEHSHIIHEKMVSLTIKIIEVDGVAPQLSRGGGGDFYKQLSEFPINLSLQLNHRYYKSFIMIKDLGQCRFT
jgi:hypothetical protein